MTKEKQDAFMARVRGVPAYVVANAMNTLTPGINWRGSSKSAMAERWAQVSADAATAAQRRGYESLSRVTLEALSDAVTRELYPRVPRG